MVQYINVPFEIALKKSYQQQEIVRVFTDTHKLQSVEMFKKADNKWYFRYTTDIIGEHIFETTSEKGTFLVESYTGENPLYKNGPIRISEDKKYLMHTDGTPFFYLADTWWYGGTNRTSIPVFQELVKDRKNKGFTAVQIVVGIPPEVEAFSEHAKNAGGYPFNENYTINPKYFDEIDKKISFLCDNGLTPFIVGGWGHHIDFLGVEHVKKFWREVIARYSAYPVIFCLTGEADVFLAKKTHEEYKTVKRITRFLPSRVISFLKKIRSGLRDSRVEKDESGLLEKRLQKWNEVGRYISDINSYKRPLTVHVSKKATASSLFHNPLWLDIDSIQSGHTRDASSFMAEAIHDSSRLIINLEPWYEGILGDFYDADQRYAFWVSILSGAKGHSYGAHGIWQMAKKGDNFMGHWGQSDFEKAMRYKGASQLGAAKKFLGNYEWWKLQSDNSVVTPHISKTTTLYPVAAHIENTHYFLYFPKGIDRKEFSLSLPANTHYKSKWYLPSSLESISHEKMKDTHHILLSQSFFNSDLLLVLSKN